METGTIERTVLDSGAGGDVILEGGTILVVDDDQLVRDSVGRVLEAEGYAVRFANDGAEALAEVRRAPPDAILLDVMMPNMNGREFLRTLREGTDGATIPVVVMTAVPGIDTNRVFTLGATDLLAKPFDIDVLLNKIALAMFRSRTHTSHTVDPVRPGVEPEPEPEPEPEQKEDAGDGVIVAIASPSDMLESLDRMLNELGCTLVSMARITDELTRLTSVLEPAAIVLDLAVDGKRGLAGLGALRALSKLRDVPVLVFSSADDIADHTDEITTFSAHWVSGTPSAEVMLSFVKHSVDSGHQHCEFCGTCKPD